MVNFSLLILSAGFGKRMLDLTHNLPKPLLKFKKQILLNNTIEFFQDIGCDEIFINTHYLHEHFEKHIHKVLYDKPIKLIYEPKILGTGGGVKNIFNYAKNKNICVVNSDIFWKQENKIDIINFIQDLHDVTYCKVLLSKKNNFYGLNKLKGDFCLKNNIVTNWIDGDEVIYYSGLQIVSKKIFNSTAKSFSMNDIWNNLIIDKNLNGQLLESKIMHIGDKYSYHNL